MNVEYVAYIIPFTLPGYVTQDYYHLQSMRENVEIQGVWGTCPELPVSWCQLDRKPGPPDLELLV